MSKWISVEDRLPEEGTRVLVYDADSKWMGTYTFLKGSRFEETFSHWMPLPQPPENG